MPNGASAPVSHASVNAAHSASAAAALAGKQTAAAATAAPVAADSTAAPTAAPTEAPLPPLLSSFMVVVHDGHLLVYVTNQSPFPVLTVPVPAALLSGGDIGVGFTAAKGAASQHVSSVHFNMS
jgi:hypothetical protein